MHRCQRSSVRWLLVGQTLLVSACSTRGPTLIGDLGNSRETCCAPRLDGQPAGRDRSTDRPPLGDLARPAGDLARPTDSSQPGPDAGFCGVVCKSGERYLISSCIATDKLYTCAPSCDPKQPSSCSATESCEPWAGTPCCICASVVPACVPKPTTGPIAGPLRIYPTSGIAGQKVSITIEGAPFYIGALSYFVRMGSETVAEEPTPSSKPCSIGATFTPPTPGIYAVEVSQYGGGPPWVLAGFYTASGGMIPDPTIQPGDFCSKTPGQPACASAKPFTCTCTAGRCVCK